MNATVNLRKSDTITSSGASVARLLAELASSRRDEAARAARLVRLARGEATVSYRHLGR